MERDMSEDRDLQSSPVEYLNQLTVASQPDVSKALWWLDVKQDDPTDWVHDSDLITGTRTPSNAPKK